MWCACDHRGETGVGKTALIEMLSKLWNQSLLLEWDKQRDRIVDFFVRRMQMGEIPADISPTYEVIFCSTVWILYRCLQKIHNMKSCYSLL